MFFGTYFHTLDNKGRIVIPSKLRAEAGRLVYILKGFDGALSIYKENEFDDLVKEIESLPFNKKNSRDYLRIQLASACQLEVDQQGRVQLPAHLLAKYGISKEVIIIGVGDHMEVWDKTTYEQYEKKVEQDFEKIAENLESHDL
ncbi:MAG: division/cell wall cluster transcriptional repressor MraZ [Erysipelotrichia bacterium]|nr:division/cell wall cluster transcriptional repressor MraZ [Erysipelotrichia bacterium]